VCLVLVVGLNIYSDRGLAVWMNQVRVHLARTIVPTNEDAVT
jgi:Tfp pilus assembly protein PilP